MKEKRIQISPAYPGLVLKSNYIHEHDPLGTYPVRLHAFDALEQGIPLSRAEVENLRDACDEFLDWIDAPAEYVVQVSLRSGPVRGGDSLYSYLDPSGGLEVGDLVKVPFGHKNKPTVAVVKMIGGTIYTGPLKAVLAKFTAEEL